MIQGLVAIFLASILTENYILSKFLGICPFLGVSKKVNTAVGMSVAVTFVMVLATAVTWPIYTYLLVPNDLAYLQTIVFILIIAALVQLVEIVLRKYIPSLYNALGIYLPLITTNCAVLGVTMLVIEKGAADPSFGYVQSLVNALGARASASSWPWCSSPACASAWRPATFPKPSGTADHPRGGLSVAVSFLASGLVDGCWA